MVVQTWGSGDSRGGTVPPPSSSTGTAAGIPQDELTVLNAPPPDASMEEGGTFVLASASAGGTGANATASSSVDGEAFNNGE